MDKARAGPIPGCLLRGHTTRKLPVSNEQAADDQDRVENRSRCLHGSRSMRDLPNFAAWREENLAKIAEDLYLQNLELREALEQLRLDLKDAMKLIREQNK